MASQLSPMVCPTCNVKLQFSGTRHFREGQDVAIFFFGHLAESSQAFDIYVCPRCGRVEMFVDGVGEEFRSEK